MAEHDAQWIKTFLQFFYRASMIPILICRGTDLLISYAPTVLPSEPALVLLKPLLAEGIEGPSVVSRHGFFFGAVPVSSLDLTVVTGPLAESGVTIAGCRDLLEDIGITDVRADDLRYRVDRSPLISRARCISILRFLDFSLNGKTDVPKELMPLPVDEQASIFQLRQSAPSTVHGTSEAEQKILQLIEEGRSDELVTVLYRITNGEYATGLDAADLLVRNRIIFTSSVALCSRAAIRGGMDYEKALSRNDEYLRQMMQIKDPDDMLPFIGLMMVDYANEVRKLQTPDDASPVSKRAVRWIQGHLEEPIKVADVAAALGYSASYLSHVFQKDMGTDIKSYILKEKTEKAKHLLAQKKTAREVAQELSFSSPSHFQTVFKKVTGMTPREYIATL